MRFPLLLLLSMPMAAQLGQPADLRIDVQARVKLVTGLDYDFQGVAADANGNLWVTATRGTATAKHKLFRFDAATGVLLGTFDQPAAADGSATGILDLAYDEANGLLLGGFEHSVSGRKVLAFDAINQRFDPSKDWIVPAAVPGQAVRALGYDKFGNQGQGSLWTADLGSPISEFSKDGTLLRTLPSLNPQCTGAAVDTLGRVIWWYGRSGSTKTGATSVGIALDLFTMQPNGQVFLGDAQLAAGCEFHSYFHTDHQVFRLVLLGQSASDTAYELEGRFNRGATCSGTIGFRGDAAWAGNSAFTLTLRGSQEAQAFLLLSAVEATTPLLPPLFGNGCYLLVGLQAPLLVAGPLPVSGGSVSLKVPIPNGIGGAAVHLQWLETSSPIQAPLKLSDGGDLYVYR
jgi:hypothetical protein